MAVVGTPEPCSPKIVEEPMAPHMTEDTICVAVGDIVMKSRSTLAWALQKSRGKRICILHVHQPAETIPLSKSAGTYTFSHFHTQARKFNMFFFSFMHICVQFELYWEFWNAYHGVVFDL